MELKKNSEFEMEITDIGSNGEGIGRFDGMTFFVNGAIIGDKILVGVTKLKKTYGYARIVKILEPSADRIEPPCPIAKRCGGCQLQPLAYKKQLEYKQKKVFNDIARLGGIPADKIVMRDIIGMETPCHYRNKGQFPVGVNRDGKIVSGFYANHTHSIIDTESCMIQHAVTDDLMRAVKDYMAETGVSAYDEEIAVKDTRKAGVVRHVLTRVGFTTKEVMVCVVINADKLEKPEALVDKLRKAVAAHEGYSLTSVTCNINKANTNVIMGEKLIMLAGEEYITDYIGDVKYRISPLSFYQVNPVQTRKLYSTALEYAGLTGSETVWDLYCGIGTISLFLAQKAKQVYGVEIVPQAIDDARANAKLNGIENAEFFVGAAEEVLPKMYEEDPSMRADVIVVDPPRKGCEQALLDCIAGLEPKRIVYVSCDPATLSRDIKHLVTLGYTLEEVTPCDMFPHSVHVETVVFLSKGVVNKDNFRKVKVDFSLEDMDLTELRGKATYAQVKEYILNEFGLKVSSLYIAQVKKKCGIETGENHNLPKSEDARQPQVTPEKEEAIMKAFRHFGVI